MASINYAQTHGASEIIIMNIHRAHDTLMVYDSLHKGVANPLQVWSTAQTENTSCALVERKKGLEHTKDLSTDYVWVWVFVPTEKNLCWHEFCSAATVCFFAYQGIEHQSVKSVTVRVLHHDVEESIQSVLQELKWQMHSMLSNIIQHGTMLYNKVHIFTIN